MNIELAEVVVLDVSVDALELAASGAKGANIVFGTVSCRAQC